MEEELLAHGYALLLTHAVHDEIPNLNQRLLILKVNYM